MIKYLKLLRARFKRSFNAHEILGLVVVVYVGLLLLMLFFMLNAWLFIVVAWSAKMALSFIR